MQAYMGTRNVSQWAVSPTTLTVVFGSKADRAHRAHQGFAETLFYLTLLLFATQ